MPRTFLHCLKGSDDRKQLIKQIQSYAKDNKCRKIKVKIPNKKNPHGLEIISKDKAKYLDNHFNVIKLFENNPDIAILQHENVNDPHQSGDKLISSLPKPIKRFKSHLRYATKISKVVNSFTPK